MARLTKAAKLEIVKNWFDKNRKAKIQKQWKDFQESVRKTFEKENKKLIKCCAEMRKLSPNDKYVNYTACFTFLVRSLNIVFNNRSEDNYEIHGFNPAITTAPFLDLYRLNASIKYDNEPYCKEYKKLTDYVETVQEEINEINNVLDSVTTDKKLLELIPEFIKYLPKEQSAGYMVPVKSVEEVKLLLNVK